jgi:hypothetical protein
VKTASLLREAAAIRRKLTNPWVDWLKAEHEEKIRHSASPAFTVVQKARAELESLADARKQFIGVAIEWTDDWDDDEHLLEAIKKAAAGKSAFSMLSLGMKTAKQRLKKFGSMASFQKPQWIGSG